MTPLKIAILCAGDDEFAPFESMIESRKISEKAMMTFYEGTLEGVPVTALFSGVGKVNAALAAQILIDTYHCNVIINAGTAGALEDSLRAFDTVISTKTAYHDVAEDLITDFHPWFPSPWLEADKNLLALAQATASQVPYRVRFGKMVTGDAFIEGEQRTFIKNAFHPLTVDMESMSIAHVCAVNHIPFLAVRTVTDTADGHAAECFEENCKKASCQSADFISRMIKAIALETSYHVFPL